MKETNEEVTLHNLEVAKNGSWLNAIFHEFNMTAKEKQEFLKYVFDQIRQQGVA